LEEENSKLKGIVPDQAFDITMLKELVSRATGICRSILCLPAGSQDGHPFSGKRSNPDL